MCSDKAIKFSVLDRKMVYSVFLCVSVSKFLTCQKDIIHLIKVAGAYLNLITFAKLHFHISSHSQATWVMIFLFLIKIKPWCL